MGYRPEPLALTVLSAPDAVRDVRTAVSELARRCGFSEERVQAIKLAVSEAVTNAVVHGYSEDAGQIAVAAEFDDGALQVVIADEGRGMLPHQDSDGLGLGLPLMSSLSDHLDIASPINEPGTEVHLIFRAD